MTKDELIRLKKKMETKVYIEDAFSGSGAISLFEIEQKVNTPRSRPARYISVQEAPRLATTARQIAGVCRAAKAQSRKLPKRKPRRSTIEHLVKFATNEKK